MLRATFCGSTHLFRIHRSKPLQCFICVLLDTYLFQSNVCMLSICLDMLVIGHSYGQTERLASSSFGLLSINTLENVLANFAFHGTHVFSPVFSPEFLRDFLLFLVGLLLEFCLPNCLRMPSVFSLSVFLVGLLDLFLRSCEILWLSCKICCRHTPTVAGFLSAPSGVSGCVSQEKTVATAEMLTCQLLPCFLFERDHADAHLRDVMRSRVVPLGFWTTCGHAHQIVVFFLIPETFFIKFPFVFRTYDLFLDSLHIDQRPTSQPQGRHLPQTTLRRHVHFLLAKPINACSNG